MSYSENTIICSTEIPTEILEKTCLKLIVLNQDDEFVNIADSVAQQEPMGFDRCVVWIKDFNFALIKDQLPDLLANQNNIAAFSISTINKVAWIISTTDPVNGPRIDRAFIEAGKNQFNK
ncbi:MAG: hypothetical protein C0397_14515 [Odoribacter sp.]|nr:hypothetical protein [Odoribacter sp.]